MITNTKEYDISDLKLILFFLVLYNACSNKTFLMGPVGIYFAKPIICSRVYGRKDGYVDDSQRKLTKGNKILIII